MQYHPCSILGRKQLRIIPLIGLLLLSILCGDATADDATSTEVAISGAAAASTQEKAPDLELNEAAEQKPAQAQAPAPAPAPAKGAGTTHVELADVLVDGQLVMQVRGTVSFPAARRADEIEQRIIAVAGDRSIRDTTVVIKDQDERTELFIDDQLMLDLFDTDAALEEISRQLLAETIKARVEEVIAAYRNDRSPEVLLEKGAYALGAVGLAMALILLSWWGSNRLTELLDRRLQRQIKQLEAKSARLVRARSLTRLLHGLSRLVYLGLVVLTLYIAINFILGLFPWTRGTADQLFGLVLDPLTEMGVGALASIPNLIRLVILYLVTRYILDMIRGFFAGIDSGNIKLATFERELAWPTYRIVRFVVVIFALVMAYPYIPGSDSDAFKGISVLLGLVISLGSSSIIGNIIAGYSLIYRRPFKVGDRVKINQIVGEVTDIRVLTTRLRSLKNEEVVIPNTTVLNGEVVNYSTRAQEQGLILHTSVGIGYETPWRQVEAMLKQAAERTGGLMRTPKPFVLQQALGDYAVTYEINAYCNDANNMAQIYSALHRNILDVFNEYGVAIMTPSYVADPDQPKLVPKEQWYTPPATPPAD
jgi:small-conductance mechanosensitive channel